MANLKKEILQALKKSNSTNEILGKISNYQNILMKNYNNPILSEEIKNKILDIHTELQNLGKSIYRHGLLKQHNIVNEDDYNDLEGVVLKGGISNVRYIWHSEQGEHTCDECAELDGQEFDMFDDIPEKPHPNCQCTIEMIEYDASEFDNDDEPCDTIIEIENLIENIENSNNEAESILSSIEIDMSNIQNLLSKIQNFIDEILSIINELESEYGKHLPECENNIDEEYLQACNQKSNLQNLLKDVFSILTSLETFKSTLSIFISNYVELLYHAYILKEFEMDKYYHSKANCEATQKLGELGEAYATILSDTKEVYDQYTYVHTHKVSVEDAVADSERDQVANRLGRSRGRENQNCQCSTLMRDLLPKYKK